ncbi:MAG: hypothetical protein JXB32_24790 [Deltaproteobacteria bacterium]|nr:hypothetical protein [Deltaproteobacteria bacterium]
MTEKNKKLIRPQNGMCVDTCPSWRPLDTDAARKTTKGECAARDRIRNLFGFGVAGGFSYPGGECPFALLRDLLGVNDLDFRIRNDGQCYACAKRRTGKCAPPLAGLCDMFEPKVYAAPKDSPDLPPHEPDLPPAEPAAPPYDKEQWERLVARAREKSYNRMFHPQPLEAVAFAQAQASKMAAEAKAMRGQADALKVVRKSLYNIISDHQDLGGWKHQVFNEEDCTCPRCKLGRLLDYIDASLKEPA